jgi:hypothetical protein
MLAFNHTCVHQVTQIRTTYLFCPFHFFMFCTLAELEGAFEHLKDDFDKILVQSATNSRVSECPL